MSGLPAGTQVGTVTTRGILHLLFGAVGFLALAGAAFGYGRWCLRRGDTTRSRLEPCAAR
jgi:hypothetical protein